MYPHLVHLRVGPPRHVSRWRRSPRTCRPTRGRPTAPRSLTPPLIWEGVVGPTHAAPCVGVAGGAGFRGGGVRDAAHVGTSPRLPLRTLPLSGRCVAHSYSCVPDAP
eukprot:1165217-Prymnesium_polylepis.1